MTRIVPALAATLLTLALLGSTWLDSGLRAAARSGACLDTPAQAAPPVRLTSSSVPIPLACDGAAGTASESP